jgi:hypothetical protein
MKSLFEKLFRKEPQFNYIIAEYQPLTTSSLDSMMDITAPGNEYATEHDEMEIDRIYQNS